MAKQIIVLGLGEFGMCLARELYRKGCEVVAIDTDEDKVQDIADDVTQAIVGDIRDEGVLKELGVGNFDVAVIGTSSSLETGILATVILKELGCSKVFAKAKTKLQGRTLKKVGADQVIFADEHMAFRLAQTITETKILDMIHFSDHFSIVEMRVPQSFWGKSIAQLDLRAEYDVNIVAIQPEHGKLDAQVTTQTILRKGDIFLVVGANEALDRLGSIH